jgi:hypothetical protein
MPHILGMAKRQSKLLPWQVIAITASPARMYGVVDAADEESALNFRSKARMSRKGHGPTGAVTGHTSSCPYGFPRPLCSENPLRGCIVAFEKRAGSRRSFDQRKSYGRRNAANAGRSAIAGRSSSLGFV